MAGQLAYAFAAAVMVVQIAAEPLPCQPVEEQPNWPTFHIVNNVTRNPDGSVTMRSLNDANAIFLYKGVYHVMNQAGGGIWTHAVSTDLAHWAHIPDALDAGPKNSTWDRQGPCDGTASFPDLGQGSFDGSVPIIMYGPDCGQPIGTPQTGRPSPPLKLGDAPRVEPATPQDPTDPYLREWVKTQPGPVTFDGTPCSFPGRVWKSKNGNYWNMLCALDGRTPWARYTSTDPTLMTWKMAAQSFTQGADSGAAAGALFHRIPNAPANGPTHMINTNTGTAFMLGTYDSETELMTITDKDGNGKPRIEVIESGNKYHWAASGNDGPDPETDSGRLLTVAWVSNRPSVISLIRDISYDQAADMLVSYPVPEYGILHNSTFFEGSNVGPVHAGGVKTLPIPNGAGGSADVSVSFEVQSITGAASGFGLAARAPPASSSGALRVSFSITAPNARGVRNATAMFSAVSGAGSKTFPILAGEALTIRVLVDRPLVEMFIQGGRAAFVSADTTFSLSNTSVNVFNQGTTSVSVVNASAYSMSCGWYAD